jgi:anti-sigma B factor antagonist
MPVADYEVRWVGQQAVVAMPAELDAAKADEIRRALLAAVGVDPAILIIDMSGTTFCDSAALKAIIGAHTQAVKTGTQLRLVATAVLRILTIVGVDQLIPIYPTLEAALTGAPVAEPSPWEPGGTAGHADLHIQPPHADT